MTSKFEQLIEYVINDDEAKAKELFHDIVVEKSREIYENLMNEESDAEEDDNAEKAGKKVAKDIEYDDEKDRTDEGDDMEEDEESIEEDMGDTSGSASQDLMREVETEEEGMREGEDDAEFDDEAEEDGEDLTHDMEHDHDGNETEHEIEDRVVDLEDKLDELMAEFEEMMGHEEGEEDFGGEEGSEEDQAMMEAIALKNVPGLYGSKIGGDNGAQAKSPSLVNSGQAGMDSKPVNFSGGTEANPTGPKGPTNYGSKGETQVKGAGSFKNSPAQNNFSEKGEKTPAPVKSQASGVNAKSPVAESRKTAKKRI